MTGTLEDCPLIRGSVIRGLHNAARGCCYLVVNSENKFAVRELLDVPLNGYGNH